MATKEKTARKDPWNDPALVGSGLTAKSIFDKLAAAAAQTPGTEKPDYSEFAKGLQEGQLALKPGGEWQTEVQPPVPLPTEPVVPMTLTEEPRVNMTLTEEPRVDVTLTDTPPTGFRGESWATRMPESNWGKGAGFSAPTMPKFPEWKTTVNPETQSGGEQILRKGVDLIQPYNLPGNVSKGLNATGGAIAGAAGWAAKALGITPTLDEFGAFLTKTTPEYQAWRQQKTQVGPQPKTGNQAPETYKPFLEAIAPGESGAKGWAAVNGMGSSARGKYQILDGTWYDNVKRYGEEIGLPNFVVQQMSQDKNGKWVFATPEAKQMVDAARVDPVLGERGALIQARTFANYLRQNLGQEPGIREMKAAWFMGSAGAVAALKADPRAPASSLGIWGKDAYTKNPNVFTRGANTTIGDVIDNYAGLSSRGGKRDGAPGVDLSQGVPIANFTTQGPLPLPERQPDKQLDYTALAALLEPLKPKGVDEDLVKKQKRDLWIQGLLSGAQSREGGIPGMLARMAGGGFAGKAQGREYERSMVDKADAEMQRFQAQKIGLMSQGMQAAVAGQNNVRDVNYANALARVQHENTMRELAGTEVRADGMVKKTTRNPDGSLSTSVYSLAPLFNEIELRQRAAYSGSSGFDAPTEVKKYAESYRYGASLEGPARTYYLYGQLAREIADNPEKMMKILATDTKDFQRKVMQNKLATGSDKDSVSMAIYQVITEMARDNPGAMPGFMKRVKDAGLVGGMLSGGN